MKGQDRRKASSPENEFYFFLKLFGLIVQKVKGKGRQNWIKPALPKTNSVRPGRKSNPRSSAYKAGALPFKQSSLVLYVQVMNKNKTPYSKKRKNNG
jgi:hypothetical protein